MRLLSLILLCASTAFADDSSMSYTYSQTTGELKLGNKLIAKGYSGAPSGKNDPDKEAVKNVGPTPRGLYTIGKPRKYKKMNDCMDLTPKGHKAHGRTEFMIHGDSKDKPGTASRGCIILDAAARKAIAESGITTLDVVR